MRVQGATVGVRQRPRLRRAGEHLAVAVEALERDGALAPGALGLVVVRVREVNDHLDLRALHAQAVALLAAGGRGEREARYRAAAATASTTARAPARVRRRCLRAVLSHGAIVDRVRT